jgi:uncharacterized membrane protein YdcZ (DUF606 family)
MKSATRAPGRAKRRRETPWWALALGLLIVMFALSATPHMSVLGVGLTLVAIFGGLSVAGWLWGADTRDGSDWKPRTPGAIR